MSKDDKKKHGKIGRGRGHFQFKEAMRESFLSAIRTGAKLNVAASRVGTTRETVNAWLKRGKVEREADMDTVRGRFYADYEQAMAACEVDAIENMKEVGGDQWKMFLAFLERRFPERWARRQMLAVTGEEGLKAADAVDLDDMSDEDLAKLEAMLSK